MTDLSKHWILFQLQDAQEELARIITDLQTDADYDETEYRIFMAHLYHHVNSAWNAREATIEDIENSAKFDEWNRFPNDIEPL